MTSALQKSATQLQESRIPREDKVRYVVDVPQMAMAHRLGRERQNNADHFGLMDVCRPLPLRDVKMTWRVGSEVRNLSCPVS